jgi:hypothetical protein
MGNYFGIDSIQSINDTIVSNLYQPPSTNKDEIRRISSLSNVNMFNIIKKNMKINVLEIYPKSTVRTNKMIIFSHGNACDNFTMYLYLSYLADSLGIMVCSYDYPNYGLSEGILNEESCNLSLRNVVKYYLKSGYKITLISQSIGTGPTIDFVSNNNWKRPVILISPYMSIPSVLSGTTLIDSCVVNHRYDSINKVDKIICPVKIFHGINDELITVVHAKELFKAIPNKKLKPTWINKCGHNDILGKITIDDYLNIINL